MRDLTWAFGQDGWRQVKAVPTVPILLAVGIRFLPTWPLQQEAGRARLFRVRPVPRHEGRAVCVRRSGSVAQSFQGTD